MISIFNYIHDKYALDCCFQLNIEVEISDDGNVIKFDDNDNDNVTEDNSKDYFEFNGTYERLTYKHNGKVQYQHKDKPEILLQFHSSWTKGSLGSLWAVQFIRFYKRIV